MAPRSNVRYLFPKWLTVLVFLGLMPMYTPLSILYAGKISDTHSSLVSFESSDHSLTLKYPHNWQILKSLTWDEGKVSSIAVGPSLDGMVGHPNQMVAILKIRG